MFTTGNIYAHVINILSYVMLTKNPPSSHIYDNNNNNNNNNNNVVLPCHRPPLPGTSHPETMVMLTAQASSFRPQYFPYYV